MIIGLCGLKRSGKDSFATFIQNSHPSFQKYSLAQPIKNAVREIFLIEGDDEEGKEDIIPEWGVSKRQLWQFVGTNLFRDVLPIILPELGNKIEKEIWIKRFIYWYRKNPCDVVITDVRFLNEVESLKKEFGNDFKIIKIIGGKSVENSDSHPSEQEVKYIVPDITIDNTGSLKKLNDSAKSLIKELGY